MTDKPNIPPEEQKFDPRQYLAIFIFRWRILVLSFLLCLLVGVLYLQFAPRQYLSKFTIRIWRDPTLQVSQAQFTIGGTFQWLLTSEELSQRSIEDLAPEWREKMGGIRAMAVAVQVEPVRGQGGMLTVSVRNANPEYARAFLNALWKNFEARLKETKRESYSSAVGLLEDELKLLEERIEEAENDLLDYARLNQMDLTSAKGSLESRYLMALLSYQNQINTELMLIEAQFPDLKDASPTVIHDAGLLTREAGTVTPVEGSEEGLESAGAGTAPDKVLTSWGADRTAHDAPEVREWQNSNARLKELELRKADLLLKFQPDHPEVKDVDKTIGEIKDQIRVAGQIALSRLSDRRESLRIAKNALEVPIRTWKNTYSMASQKNAAYRRKSLTVDRIERMYRDLYGRLHDLKVSEELKAEHVNIVQLVTTQGKPVRPDIPKIMAMIAVLAVGSGIGLATLAHVFDNRMQTIADVEKVVGVPFLGGIPHWTRKKSSSTARPLVLEEHASGAVEAYRVLRTSIIAAMEKVGHNVILVTSSESKEGKTLTAINLAVMMAKVGKKVLLMDMDLRRPRVHKSFNVEKTPGMTEVLNGKIELDRAIVSTGVENLSFVPGGETCDNAAEVLQSADMGALLASARKKFDFIVIDTSPVLRTADASIIARPEVCSVVFVASVNRTPKPLVRYALDMLGKAHILGIVMNNIEMNKISSLYYTYQYPNYAYYAYAYAYGYNYDYLYAEGGAKQMRPSGNRWSDRFKSVSRWARRTFLPLE